MCFLSVSVLSQQFLLRGGCRELGSHAFMHSSLTQVYWKVSEDKKAKCAEKGKSKQVIVGHKEPACTFLRIWIWILSRTRASLYMPAG